MGAAAVTIANRWLLGWPDRVMALLVTNQYLVKLAEQTELEKNVLAEANVPHLTNQEILKLHNVKEFPPQAAEWHTSTAGTKEDGLSPNLGKLNCVASMFDCLDGPDQVAMDLTDPAIAKRLRQDMAKRAALYPSFAQHEVARRMTREELIKAVPIRESSDGRLYVRIDDVPEPWRQQFATAIIGSAFTAINGETCITAFSHDWDAWVRDRWDGRPGPTGLDES